MKKTVVYKCLHYRKDGTLISDTWEMTQREYEYYKLEMPRRAQMSRNGNTFEFKKIKPKTIEYSTIPGLSKYL